MRRQNTQKMKVPERRGFLEKAKRKLDWHGDIFQFRLPDGKKSKKTWSGCIFTVTTITAVILYMVMQFLQLSTYQDPSIMVSTRDSFYSTDHEFTTDEGFQFAFGITAFDDVQEPIEDA